MHGVFAVLKSKPDNPMVQELRRTLAEKLSLGKACVDYTLWSELLSLCSPGYSVYFQATSTIFVDEVDDQGGDDSSSDSDADSDQEPESDSQACAPAHTQSCHCICSACGRQFIHVCI